MAVYIVSDVQILFLLFSNNVFWARIGNTVMPNYSSRSCFQNLCFVKHLNENKARKNITVMNTCNTSASIVIAYWPRRYQSRNSDYKIHDQWHLIILLHTRWRGSVFTNNKPWYLLIFRTLFWWSKVCTYMINKQKRITFMSLNVFINVHLLVYHTNKGHSLIYGHGTYKIVKFIISHQLYIGIGL